MGEGYFGKGFLSGKPPMNMTVAAVMVLAFASMGSYFLLFGQMSFPITVRPI
jgi:hypothetical protein